MTMNGLTPIDWLKWRNIFVNDFALFKPLNQQYFTGLTDYINLVYLNKGETVFL
jgi:hypothetical protein